VRYLGQGEAGGDDCTQLKFDAEQTRPTMKRKKKATSYVHQKQFSPEETKKNRPIARWRERIKTRDLRGSRRKRGTNKLLRMWGFFICCFFFIFGCFWVLIGGGGTSTNRNPRSKGQRGEREKQNTGKIETTFPRIECNEEESIWFFWGSIAPLTEESYKREKKLLTRRAGSETDQETGQPHQS